MVELSQVKRIAGRELSITQHKEKHSVGKKMERQVKNTRVEKN